MRLRVTILMLIGLSGLHTSAQVGAGDNTELGQPASAILPKGPSFRVETEVFSGDSVQPEARHLVLFDSGVIYDFRLDNDRFVSMYDPARGRVLMIDRKMLHQTSITTEELLEKTAQLRAAVLQEGKGEKFGLSATVAPALEANPGDTSAFEIGFGDTKYTVTTQQVKNADVARSYNHFATLAAQLNVAQGFGAPPFARMTLGQYIADAGLLPLQTVLEVRLGLRKERWKSQLYVVEQLAVLDRQRISKFGELLGTCESVKFEDFGK